MSKFILSFFTSCPYLDALNKLSISSALCRFHCFKRACCMKRANGRAY